MSEVCAAALVGEALTTNALRGRQVQAFSFTGHRRAFDPAVHLLARDLGDAPTFGWDTAFAIRFPDANAAIATQHSSPPSFQMSAPDGSCSASGTFGDWQITGGDGIDLHMSVPLAAGSLDYKGQGYDLAGVVARIEVQLTYLPPPPAPAIKPVPSTHALRLKQQVSGVEKAVSVLGVTAENLGFMQRCMIQGLLELWLNANLRAFDHTFSAVTLNPLVANEGFEWLAPTTSGYACVKRATEQESILAVLCMTENRSTDTLAGQISGNAIPPGARAGFLISQERFLEKMVMPALPKVFLGANASDFRMSDDKTAIITTARVKTKPIWNAGVRYQPEITVLNISIHGEEIIVYTETETNIDLGSISKVSVTSFQRLILVDKPDGTQTLSYQQSRPPIQDNSTETDAEGEAQKVIIEIAAAIVGIILTVATDGAFLVVALIILALLVGLFEAIPKQIADVVGKKISNDSPSLALLVSNSTDPIVWQGERAFRLTSVGLAGSVRLGGNPGFL